MGLADAMRDADYVQIDEQVFETQYLRVPDEHTTPDDIVMELRHGDDELELIAADLEGVEAMGGGTFRLRSGERDLHSGVYGGAALNAVHALMDTLRAVTSVPEELRRGIVPPTAEEIAAWEELDSGEASLADQGARPADERAAEEFYLRTFAGAAVDVNGIVGGEPHLQKTVLPVEAEANVSIRLAPGQDAEEIALAFERILREAAPAGATVDVER